MAETTYVTQRLDHLGIVAGICQEIELAGQIDRMIGPTDRQVSVGEAVQAMVLNALGFVSRPLYLTPEFFNNKPLDRLLRPGLTAEMLNDDSLGRALDILYEAGPTEVFAQVASHALRLWGIRHRFVHLDTTSLSVEGEYEGPEEPGVVHITHGYSRDGRPDLKQVVVALLTSYRSALPLWIQALDGNASDTHTFPQVVEAYIAQLQEGEMPYLVADSALYSEDNLQRLAGVCWLTRVPERIGLAQALIEEITAQEMWPAGQEGYRYLELCTTYGGVRQRWADRLVGAGRETGASHPPETGEPGTRGSRTSLEELGAARISLPGGRRGSRGTVDREVGLSPGGSEIPAGDPL
jgi:transposase